MVNSIVLTPFPGLVPVFSLPSYFIKIYKTNVFLIMVIFDFPTHDLSPSWLGFSKKWRFFYGRKHPLLSYQNIQNICCVSNESHLGLSNAYIHDLSLAWLGTDSLVKRDGDLFMGACYFSNEWASWTWCY